MARYIFVVFLGALSAGTLPSSAATQTLPLAVFNGVHRSDVAAVMPTIRSLLGTGAIGANSPWTSNRGKTGFIYLVSGGDRQQSSVGRVRISVVAKKRERTYLLLDFGKDKQGVWQTSG